MVGRASEDRVGSHIGTVTANHISDDGSVTNLEL